ncbi:hypothetical protein [Tenacibaculum sp. M341]|uniref:hypothetical protein n=1 Tax=Tenacibaculum sp. M341 TaxID=2530339 RepID=UPI001044455A|nr:hypothetical protein [Tenacibaculum sp. M341]TCI84829.1 hypothetical protein EYW44_19600 [Tenacibaculum sp. M341]
MKKIIIILISVFTSQLINAQDFISETKKYDIINSIGTKQDEYTTNFDVITTGTEVTKVGTIHISDLETFHDISVQVLPKPNLEGIKEVIKVTTNYIACCGYSDTFYFLVTNDSDFIRLPHIENTFCEETVSEVQYVFPIQKYGKANMILRTEITYDKKIETIKETEVLQSLVWNDAVFDSNEVITSIPSGKEY